MVDTICKEDGCELKRWARGLCRHHYDTFHRSGAFTKKPKPTVCREPGCGQPRKAGTTIVLCENHFKEWRERHHDPEKKAAQDRAYYERNAEHIRTQKKDWYQENRERVLATVKARYEADPEPTRARAHRWEREHPEVRQDKRAKKKGAFVESVDRQVVFERDGGVCQLCRLPVDADDWHLDHVIPLSRGGLHCYSNVQVAHPRCNMVKHAKVPLAVAA